MCASLADKRVSPHTLRHTTAMHLIRSGNDINMVSYWLGHADINTTHVYVEIDMEMKKKMLEKASSPAVKRIAPWRKPGMLDWLKALTKPRDYVQPMARLRPLTTHQRRRNKSASHNSALHITFACSPRPVVFAGRKPTGKDP